MFYWSNVWYCAIITTYITSSETDNYIYNRMNHHLPVFVEINGIRLHYEAVGKGRPLVLLHGNGGDMSIFDNTVRELKEFFNVITVDTRGHGLSQTPLEYHYEDMADDIHQLITILKLDKPILFGFSDGGITGLILASKYPDDLHRLIVAGANTNPSAIDWGDETLDKDDPLIRLMLDEPHISVSDLESIKIPTLVIAGEFDSIKRSDTDKIANSIPNSSLVIVPNSDHGGYIANTVALPRILKEWLL